MQQHEIVGVPNGKGFPAGTTSLQEIAARFIRERIAQEIVQEIPDVIHRVASRVGTDTLVDPQETLEDLPDHIQPLARALRKLVRHMSRELNRELASVTFKGFASQPAPAPGIPAGYPMTESPQPAVTGTAHGNAVEQLSNALSHYLQDVVNHAVGDAVAQVRPGMTRQQFVRPTPRSRMEQPTA